MALGPQAGAAWHSHSMLRPLHRALNCFWLLGCLGGTGPSTARWDTAQMLPHLAADSRMDLGRWSRFFRRPRGVGSRNFSASRAGRAVGR